MFSQHTVGVRVSVAVKHYENCIYGNNISHKMLQMEALAPYKL